MPRPNALFLSSAVLLTTGLMAFPVRAQDKVAQQKELYDKHCKKCHAADGSGKKDGGEWLPVAKTLKLKKPEKLDILSADAKKLSDDEIVKMILEGKEKMKAMKDKVTQAEAKLLVEYTRHLQGQAK